MRLTNVAAIAPTDEYCVCGRSVSSATVSRTPRSGSGTAEAAVAIARPAVE